MLQFLQGYEIISEGFSRNLFIRFTIFLKGEMSMEISVCMIVKNEEKLLRRCLDSLSGLYEELIIVDTGSTDKTKEIAWEYTDEVYDFEWVSDFAAARNFAFSKCTKDYIYTVDADEVLDAENMEKFRVLKGYLDPKYEIVKMWYLTPLDFNEANGFEKEYRPKLFKRLRSWTWIDPVHESMQLEPTIFDSDICIRHLPSQSHIGRDCAIYEKVINRGGTLSPKLHGLYARDLYMTGSKEELLRAKEYFYNFVQATTLNLTSDDDLSMKKKKDKSTLWESEVQLADSDAPEDISNTDWNMYREALCVLAKIARVEGNMKMLYEVAMTSMITGPCSEVCLEVGIAYYELGDYVYAKNWLNIAMNNTSPTIDPAAGNTKPRKYLNLMK